MENLSVPVFVSVAGEMIRLGRGLVTDVAAALQDVDQETVQLLQQANEINQRILDRARTAQGE